MSSLILNKLKSGIKSGTEIILKILSNVVVDSNDENNFSYKLLLTTTQVSKLRKAFLNNSSANIRISKTQFHKMEQSGGLLGILLAPLLKIGFPLMENILRQLSKNLLIPLGLTGGSSATNTAIHKKMSRSSRPLGLALRTTTLIISNKEMDYFMKTFKYLNNLLY